MEPIESLSINTSRRFGVELEVNAFDGLDRPLTGLPDGIGYIGNLVAKTCDKPVYICDWGYNSTNNNLTWIVKPDSSCGIEICSPVVKGVLGISETAQVVSALGKDDNVVSDDRCSFHVHVEVADCNDIELATILAYWIKSELVFVDSVPALRKKNRYSQLIAVSDFLEHDSSFAPEKLISILGRTKYNTINTYHMNKGRRQTIEFRIMEGTACTDPTLAENWIKLLLHFVDRAKSQDPPGPYVIGDQWSSFVLLDPFDVFEFLGFNGGYELSSDLQQVKNWFLKRLEQNSKSFEGLSQDSFWSAKSRAIAIEQVSQLSTQQDIY